MDVNQIFKDLGQMVYEQGEMIGKILAAIPDNLFTVRMASSLVLFILYIFQLRV